MSSTTLWHDPNTGVEARWEKEGRYTVFTPTNTADGITSGTTRHYRSLDSAIRAAKRKAKAITRDAAPKRLSELIGPF